jgi:RNA polymerase sigma-70 factor (ECF subfamily)
MSMPPWRQWYRGRAAIQAFHAWAWRAAGPGSFRLVPTAANRQPAFAQYVQSPDGPEWRAHAIWLLTLQDDAIAVLTGFIDPRLFAAFGLPTVLPPEDAAPSASRA